MRPLVKAVVAGVVGLAALGVGTAVAAGGPGGSGGVPGSDGRLVLVSGRDDHGELADPQVALHRWSGGGPAVAQVKDGSLARVLATDGTWLKVVTVANPSAEGWVDDYYLRGTVHLVGEPPTCRVRLGGRLLPEGEQAVVLDARGVQARVRLVRTGETGWVPRSAAHDWLPDQGCAPAPSGGPSDGPPSGGPSGGLDDDR